MRGSSRLGAEVEVNGAEVNEEDDEDEDSSSSSSDSEIADFLADGLFGEGEGDGDGDEETDG
jgi:hypothetical protein